MRGGKAASCKVTLGEFPNAETTQIPNVYRFTPDERFQNEFGGQGGNNESMWTTFDELKLSRIDDKHWNAEIIFRNKDGKKESKKFTGTREEIRKNIENEKDLPANEKHHLLRAIGHHPPVFEFYLPDFKSNPQGQDSKSIPQSQDP